MAAFFQSPVTLALKDFVFFHRQFCREVESLLPVRGTVSFFEQSGAWLAKEQVKVLLGKGFAKLPSLCASMKAAVMNGYMILPVAVTDGENVAVLIGDIDKSLLKRMAPAWLQELREQVQGALVQTKQAYVFPDTGLYNSRLLEHILADPERDSGVFYLIGTSERTQSPTGNLIKVMQTARLLEATVTGPALYFGGNIYGVYQEHVDRENALHFARRILGRLKREELHSVHIGIVLIQDTKRNTAGQVLDEAWKALETAEKRGPFSLCESSCLDDWQGNPLARPDRETVRKLQGRWRGTEQFCLLLFRIERSGRRQEWNAAQDGQPIRDTLRDGYIFVPTASGEYFVLLPGVKEKEALQEAKKIKHRLDTALHPGQVAAGISCWPCVNFPRTATIVNCRKALMHGDFFGPGSVTLFDQVSLNVSGDHFFDEGNYRQAVRDYRAGLMLKPDEVNLMNSLGVALTELNRLNQAVHCFDKVLNEEPQNFMALVNKGFALRMLGKPDGALNCLAAAEKSKEFSTTPVAADVSLQLGRLYIGRGEHKKAVRVLERMRSRNEEKTGYLLCSLLGEAYAANGSNDKAITLLQQAIRYNPHDARSLSILGDLYGKEGEGDEIALSLCNRAVHIDDHSWENWYRLAGIRYKLGDYDGALAAVGESLHINGKAVDAVFLAGRILVRLGNRNKAKKMFQKVRRIAPGFRGAIEQLKQF